MILIEDKRPQAPPTLEQVEPQVRQLVMRDKYLELLNSAKESTAVEISDPALKKAYDEAGKPQETK